MVKLSERLNSNNNPQLQMGADAFPPLLTSLPVTLRSSSDRSRLRGVGFTRSFVTSVFFASSSRLLPHYSSSSLLLLSSSLMRSASQVARWEPWLPEDDLYSSPVRAFRASSTTRCRRWRPQRNPSWVTFWGFEPLWLWDTPIPMPWWFCLQLCDRWINWRHHQVRNNSSETYTVTSIPPVISSTQKKNNNNNKKEGLPIAAFDVQRELSIGIDKLKDFIRNLHSRRLLLLPWEQPQQVPFSFS